MAKRERHPRTPSRPGLYYAVAVVSAVIAAGSVWALAT